MRNDKVPTELHQLENTLLNSLKMPMPDNKQQPSATQSTESVSESWRKWKVKPDLVFMPTQTDDPKADVRATEAGIGKRIAYCRGQLDNLSVEAFVRYTKNFDADGISRMSIIRYEAGESLPGARELQDSMRCPVGVSELDANWNCRLRKQYAICTGKGSSRFRIKYDECRRTRWFR